MVLRIKEKKDIVYELQEKISVALSIVVASLSGVTANLANQLRKKARDFEVCMKVVPNSLLRRAVLKTSYECLSEFFVGESIIAFSIKKPNDAARVFVEFSRDYENLKIKGAAFEGKVIRAEQIDLLSNLPDYKESILQFMLVLKLISIGSFIKVLQKLSDKEI